MRRAAILLALIATLAAPARAQVATDAQAGALADAATTVAALAAGAVEANPLGLFTLPVKLLALHHAHTLPEGARQHQLATLGALWAGAAVNNACVLAAILTGGAFAPACLVAGIAAGAQRWQASSDERAFWAICADERARRPDLRCTWNTTPA